MARSRGTEAGGVEPLTSAAFFAALDKASFPSYHEAVGKPEKNVKRTQGFCPGSSRALWGQVYAIALLLVIMARPYVVVLTPLWWAIRQGSGGWPTGGEVAAWLFFAAWHGAASYVPKRSPRTDGRQGAAPHGVVSPAGWYFDASNSRLAAAFTKLRAAGDYDARRTSWVLGGGDLHTLLPFVTHGAARHSFRRRWLRVPLSDGPNPRLELQAVGGNSDCEAVAVDVLVPRSGVDPTKPFLLLLAGLTGGSDEGYLGDMLQDAVHSRGMTAAVMVARGCAGGPCSSDALFTGARTSDAAAAVRYIKTGAWAAAAAETKSAKPQVYACGVSMGGIILANLMAQAGGAVADAGTEKVDDEFSLAGGVVLSGGLKISVTSHFFHSRRLWQPLLVQSLKDNFIGPCLRRLKSRGVDLGAALDGVDLLELDSRLVAAYGGYRDVWHYYNDMSASETDDRGLPPQPTAPESGAAPWSAPSPSSSRSAQKGRDGGSAATAALAEGDGGELDRSARPGGLSKGLGAVRSPMLVVHACDDPIIHCDSVPVKPCLAPGSSVMTLLTSRGGHIGWPTGLLPWKHRWDWSNTVALEFIEAIHSS